MFAVNHTPGTEVPGVGLAFTDRDGGFSEGPWRSFNLGRIGQDPDVGRNLELLRTTLGLRSVARVDQTHTATVLDVVDPPDGQFCVPTGSGEGADALVTRECGVGLLIRVADCVPVLFADEAGTVVGAAHAGRVGLLAGILPATVERMRRWTDAPIRAWIGPHICGNCYEVPATMRADAAALVEATHAVTSWGTPSIDLGAGAQQQLEACRVQVTRFELCTRTNPDRFFSHRVDPRAGRQAGIIHLAPSAA